MGVRRVHDHQSGKVCYTSRTRHRIAHRGLYRVGYAEVIVAYMPYTGHWYAWDPETGDEVATFTSDFYERCIRPAQIGTLVADPDCET